MVANNRVRLVCADCKHKVAGTRGQGAHHGCDRCGGQLREVTYRPARKNRGKRGW